MTRIGGCGTAGCLSVLAALLTGGCSGGGNMVLGPNPQSSVSPVSSPSSPPAAATPAAAAQTAHSLADVRSWSEPALVPAGEPAAAQAALAGQPQALLILDPAAVAATAGADPKRNPLAALHGRGPRRILALMDIGEIAKTNPLWQSAWADAAGKPAAPAPAWLTPADPKTPGIFPVQYWNADWQKRAASALNALVAAGYDGVCLEGVGDFTHFAKARPTAGPDMAAFVEALAASARRKAPAFSVVTDGGVGLPDVLTGAQTRDYFAAVDGILARDVFYPGDKPADNPLAPDSHLLAALGVFQKAGKPVFVTERLTDPDKIADFLARAKSLGFLPDSALTPPAPAPPQVAEAPRAAHL